MDYSRMFGSISIKLSGAKGSHDEEEDEFTESLSFADTMIFSHSKTLESCIDSMNSFLDTPDALNDKVIRGIDKQGSSAKDVLHLLNITKDNIKKEETKGGDKKLTKSLMKIVHLALPMTKQFLEASNKKDVEQIPSLEEKLDSLCDQISEINIKLSARARVPANHKRGPGMLKQAASMFGGRGKKSLVDHGLEQAHMKLEVTRAQLQSTQDQADKAMEKQLEVNRRLQESMMQIAKFEAEGKTHAEVMEVLQQGLKAFGQLKEQWTKLLLFFHSMSNLIETSLGPPLKEFVEHANMIKSEKQEGFEPSEFCRELIYQPAKEAVKV